tara:strand:+ start:71599 stop:72780 length:1182 start_codon:yes stop_codon:yes gene_type:complete
MSTCARIVASVMLSLLCLAATAQSSRELSLHDTLEMAMQRHGDGTSIQDVATSAWLAGLPSVGLTYLDSQEKFGTDETELSINLPIKSFATRRADNAMQQLALELDALNEEQRKLYFSGLLRDAAWAYRLADAKRRFVQKKRNVLQQLMEQQAALVEANAASSYTLLTLQKELVDTQLQEQSLLARARQSLNRFRALTGLGEIPANLAEGDGSSVEFQPENHPHLRALSAYRSQQEQLLAADRASSGDWDLSVVGKNIETAGFEEEQIGVSVELPLAFVDMDSHSNRAQYRQIQREYAMASEQLQQQLLTEWERVRIEYENLQARQRLLDQSADLTKRIADQVETLWNSRSIAPEIALRRLLDARDARSEQQLNMLQLQYTIAMLRQAAGESL